MCADDRLNLCRTTHDIKFSLLEHRTFGLFLINDRVTIATKVLSILSNSVACKFDFCIFFNAIFSRLSPRMFCLGRYFCLFCVKMCLERRSFKHFTYLPGTEAMIKCSSVKNDLFPREYERKKGKFVLD